mmetsp:Transcript_107317/g.346322  ORF Transcript_107317/g.346322 Transcript_107317/m.346322 type:complete len:200 (+) Transcript_107317:347-946(+)
MLKAAALHASRPPMECMPAASQEPRLSFLYVTCRCRRKCASMRWSLRMATQPGCSSSSSQLPTRLPMRTSPRSLCRRTLASKCGLARTGTRAYSTSHSSFPVITSSWGPSSRGPPAVTLPATSLPTAARTKSSGFVSQSPLQSPAVARVSACMAVTFARRFFRSISALRTICPCSAARAASSGVAGAGGARLDQSTARS